MSRPLMEEETAKILTLSDLITGAHPVTGVSSITPKNPVSDFDWQRYDQPPKPVKPTPQNTTSKILKPLKHPTVLFGTISLPIHHQSENLSSSIECSCFQFSDGSATVCCDILHFHPQIIGRIVRVHAWNFVPLKAGCSLGGFLEIISWENPEISGNFTSFPLVLDSVTDSKDGSKAKYSLFGVLESISPVSVVPCSIGDRSSVSSSRNLCGFLVKIKVCDCMLCGSRKGIVALRDLTGGNHKVHCFVKSFMVYFYGSASSWHPAIVRLIASVVALSGLKRKLVYIGKDDSEIMCVTTKKTLLHVPEVIEKCISNEKPELRGLGEVGSYAGTVTGVYMQGTVVELDQELLLLLTDHQLMVPHSLRVGAIVSVRNVHFLNPKFSWTKTLVLGACVVTCICTESFSPFESGGYKRSHSQSLFWEFVDSLAFPARLWVLLTVTCFHKKFSGISSEKEILGSKNKVGLAQAYATSCLPASAYQKRLGVFVEYCKHSSCNYVVEEDYSRLKLAVPISCFRSYVENRWMKMLLDEENDFNIMSNTIQRNFLFFRGRSYAKFIRKIFQSEDIAVSLLGYIKVSPSSGSLQLVDASGSIDAVIPDIPPSWDFNRIYEVEDFKVIMQGIPDKLNNLELFPCEPFTCRSIFEGFPLKRETMLSVFLYHHFRDEESKIYPSPNKYSKISFQQFDGGHFHLLWLKHKFPYLHKSLGDQDISNRSGAFAEAVVLPWDLIFPEKDEIAYLTGLHLDEHRNFWRYEKKFGLKRCKTDKTLSDGKLGSYDAGNFKCGCFYNSYCNKCTAERNHRDLSFKFPCLVSSRSLKCPCQGFVYCTDKKAVTSSGFKPGGRGILLEFDSESLYMYQGLRIGAYYIVKDTRNDFLCAGDDDNNVTRSAMLITSETYLWSLSLSSDVVLENSDPSSIFPFVSNHEIKPDASQQSEILPLEHNSVCPESFCSEINLCVPSDIIHYLKIDNNVSESGLLKSSLTFEDSEMYNGNGTVITRPLLSSGTGSSDLLLPEGDLLSLHGHVVSIHDSNGASFFSHTRHESSIYAHRSIFPPGTSMSCIHVRIDQQMTMIFGDLGKNTCPAGFGPGVEATFHRILVLGGQNQYMLLSTSFIVLDSANVADYQYSDESASTTDSLIAQSVISPGVFPAALISEITESMDFKPMQLHVRVVGIYVLVLQKNKKAGNSSTKVQSCSSVVDIPLAGFIVDDGSSSCCCWANYVRAANILGLPTESTTSEACLRTSSRSTSPARGEANVSSVGHLNSILRQHHRVLVKNYGFTLDSSCLDFTISVDSKELMSNSHENIIRGLIMNACFSNLWTVVGCLMNSTAMHRLEKKLSELEMTLLPLQNVWATAVYHTDPLAESRIIIQGLVNS